MQRSASQISIVYIVLFCFQFLCSSYVCFVFNILIVLVFQIFFLE